MASNPFGGGGGRFKPTPRHPWVSGVGVSPFPSEGRRSARDQGGGWLGGNGRNRSAWLPVRLARRASRPAQPGHRNESNFNLSSRINPKAGLVPAAALVPAPIMYIEVVAVRKIVVGGALLLTCIGAVWRKAPAVGCFAAIYNLGRRRVPPPRPRLPLCLSPARTGLRLQAALGRQPLVTGTCCGCSWGRPCSLRRRAEPGSSVERVRRRVATGIAAGPSWSRSRPMGEEGGAAAPRHFFFYFHFVRVAPMDNSPRG